jgi:hypothetical protein
MAFVGEGCASGEDIDIYERCGAIGNIAGCFESLTS